MGEIYSTLAEQTSLLPAAQTDAYYNLADERTFRDCPIKEEQLDSTGSSVLQTPAESHIELEVQQFGGYGEAASCESCVDGIACPTCRKKKKCEVCGRCVRRSDFAKHRRIHTGEKPYSCQKCGMQFRQQSHLKRHQASVHTGARPFKCILCPASFTQSGSLSQHILIHTEEKPYQCQKCGMQFRHPGTLKQHEASVHSTARNHKCDECDKSFKVHSALMQHKRLVHKCAYRCADCEETFLTYKDFAQHHTEVHVNVPQTPTDTYEEYDAQQFRDQGEEVTQSTFANHRRVYSGDRPFKCARCLACFSERKILWTHLRIHTGETPYQCQVCGAQFRQLSNLVGHETCIHSTARNYKCTECYKTYKMRSALMYHKRHIHKCAYRCADCEETFLTYKDFAQHRIEVHIWQTPTDNSTESSQA